MSLDIFKDLQNGILPKDLHPETNEGKIIKVLLKAIESTDDMVVITNAPDNIGEEEIIFVNKAFEETTGYSREEVLGRTPSFLQGSDTDEEVIEELVTNLERGESFEGETFNYKKDGSRYRVKWRIDPIHRNENEITHFVSVQRDVTEEWETKQRLKEMLEEREVLLKETHHRVKNNLATITGLLEMQIMESDSEEVKMVLLESMNRVQSIASVHEKLYKTEGIANITLDSYLKDLLKHMGESSTILGVSSQVDVDLNLEEISIGTRQAVSLGLIINELVTNTHKHAFDEGTGIISITCREENGKVHLHFKDNGNGLPKSMEISSLQSLGMKLIQNLCKQLEADYRFYNDNGAHFELKFSRSDTKKV